MNEAQFRKQFADRLAPPMFALSLLFLLLVGILIVGQLAKDLVGLEGGPTLGWATGLLLLLWPLFLLEYLVTVWIHRDDIAFKWLMLRAVVCVVPPLRLASPARARDYQIWLPGLGWRYPGRSLSFELERFFGKPMLVIALLILPVLLMEFAFKDTVAQHNWLKLTLHCSTGFIWCAFAFEFIIMVSATHKKFAYVKKNWIDLAIVLLPLISFLRSVRVLRIARVVKLQKLAKLGRVYRMRGLGMKALKALMLLQSVNRLLGITPEKKLAKLKYAYAEKKEELEELQQDILELENSIAENRQEPDPTG